ncbi:hypothetical protein F5Y00DRAFT_242322 [Daldinia vernicosa]|uniref:uncharacterized protein n=1 Tax=Daldinia vernicosa TaxID=114800 RepID=UPI0020072FB8|nr:uncharacterized protein F5Y00DRAFT_242322 [Daldinia vernicosa]KAI0847093.1 hypothetical protein F5Y00DRAFT_242322 [Daldinia vernicosa]
MAQSKEKEAQDEELPAYEEFSGPSTFTEIPETGPTAASPFNFPPDSDLPPYSALAANTSDKRPIAIPQIKPDPTSPFLEASSPSLLRHGITQETWLGFIRTLSGFLAATVSQKAISHAGDMAQYVGDVPKRFGKDTMAHIKASGQTIKDTAKSGNVVGAAVHVVGATIRIPVATALRAVGAAVTLPFAAINAASREPKTPKERAIAYTAAANIKWLHWRGLDAHLLDTAELGQVLGLSVDELLQTSRGGKDESAEGQLAALGGHIAELDVRVPSPLELGAGTFWLVVTERGEDREDASEKDKGKGKEKERKGDRRSKEHT